MEVARYREAVDGTARWIERTAYEHEDGSLTWSSYPDSKADYVQDDLGWGGFGPVLFLADLYRSTSDAHLLELAERGAAHMRDAIATAPPNAECGLFKGLGGAAVVFDELYRATGDHRYVDDVVATFDYVRDRSSVADSGVHWDETTEILWGTAGIGCLMLDIAPHVGADATELAARAGEWLLSQVERVDGGACWSIGEGKLRERPASRRVRYPNFAHGTAGIAFFMAKLALATDDKRFLDAALDAARWVLTTCRTDGGGCIAYHHRPEDRDDAIQIGAERPAGSVLYTLGWCHGPPGLGWFFRELQLATGDDEWAAWVKRTAHTVRTSGIPEQLEPGFWDNTGRCCGSAGVIEYFLDLHSWRADPDDLYFAGVVADDLLARATVDAQGTRWSNVEFRADPPTYPPSTNFLQGASGIGMTLLRFARHVDGDRHVVRLPHEPRWNESEESAPGRFSIETAS